MFSLNNYITNSLCVNLSCILFINFCLFLANFKLKPSKLFINQVSINTHSTKNNISYKNITYSYINVLTWLLFLLIMDTFFNFSYTNVIISNTMFFIYSFFLINSCIFFFVVTKLAAKSFTISLEYISTLYMIMCFPLYYFFISNFFIFFLVLELHSLIFLYLIIVFFFTKNNTQVKNIFNLILLQFWLAFLGSLLFLMFLVFTQYNTSTLLITEINIVLLFLNPVYNKIFSILFFSFFIFKLGIFPYHMWKLDFFRLLPSWLIFVYNILYTFPILLFLLKNLSSSTFITLFLTNIIEPYLFIILIFVPGFFFFITELRSFFLISSNIQLCLFLFILVFSSPSLKIFSSFFLLSYFSLLLLSSLLLIFFSKLNIWFLTDLQLLKIPFFINLLICFLMSSAGIPPFWGFFCKLSIVSFCFNINSLLLAFIILIGGYLSAYFYWQLLRFISLKNVYINSNKLLLRNTLSLNSILLSLLLINVFSFFFLQDLFIFSSYFVNI